MAAIGGTLLLVAIACVAPARAPAPIAPPTPASIATVDPPATPAAPPASTPAATPPPTDAGQPSTPPPTADPRPAPVPGSALPPGFVAETVMTDLDRPVTIRFGPDGRIWIAEQAGLIRIFDGLEDPRGRIFADLREEVLAVGDRGLLGLALHPTDPRAAYVLYAFDGPIGGPPGRYGEDPSGCESGADELACIASGALSLLRQDGRGPARERQLIHGWCHHGRGHPPDALAWGPDGALYLSAGDGGSADFADDGSTVPDRRRCHDGSFAAAIPPDARAPGQWNGTVVRIPGDALEAAGLAEIDESALANSASVVAYGLRNPFRMAVRPETPELWIADTGWNQYEEIDRLADATSGEPVDFGWPCREGPGPQPEYAALVPCRSSFAPDFATADPWFTYRHDESLQPGDPCGAGPAAISVIAFHDGQTLPEAYRGALFFGDVLRGCIWVALAGSDGAPDADSIEPFWTEAGFPADLVQGPDGALYLVDVYAGTVDRIVYRGTESLVGP